MASKCYKENLIKPHSRTKWFRMPAGKLRKPQNDISQPGIVPGKLADESQLGGLSSLLQLTKEPIIEVKPPLPKPLKKRYRDAVYDSIEPIVEHPPPHIVPEPKIEENGENSKSPVETSEEDEERLKVWRSHILEENVNIKKTRARACKGQRYREFMWTNYSNRRRSNSIDKAVSAVMVRELDRTFDMRLAKFRYRVPALSEYKDSNSLLQLTIKSFGINTTTTNS